MCAAAIGVWGNDLLALIQGHGNTQGAEQQIQDLSHPHPILTNLARVSLTPHRPQNITPTLNGIEAGNKDIHKDT